MLILDHVHCYYEFTIASFQFDEHTRTPHLLEIRNNSLEAV